MVLTEKYDLDIASFRVALPLADQKLHPRAQALRPYTGKMLI